MTQKRNQNIQTFVTYFNNKTILKIVFYTQ